MFCFGSQELLNWHFEDMLNDEFKEINRITKDFLLIMLNKRVLKLKSLTLQQRPDIWSDKLAQ